MKNNIISALIIAAAIVSAVFFSRQNGAAQIQAVLNQLEESAQIKDSEGNTQISRIASGLSRSAAGGIRKGFQGGQHEDSKQELEVRQRLVIKDLKILPGRMKNQEKLIGLIRNDSSETVKSILLNVLFKDSEEELIDVSSKFSNISGILKLGDELGFEVERELGSFQETEEILAQRKASSAAVNVANFSIVK